MTTLKDRIHLIERLDRLISMKATGSPCELARRLNFSERHLYRVIEEMKILGFPIAYSKSRRTYYYEKEVWFRFEVCVVDEKTGRTTTGGKKSDLSNIFFQTDRFWQSFGFYL